MGVTLVNNQHLTNFKTAAHTGNVTCPLAAAVVSLPRHGCARTVLPEVKGATDHHCIETSLCGSFHASSFLLKVGARSRI